MVQQIVRTVPGLISAAGNASGGAAQHGETIGLKHITKPVIDAALGELIVGRETFEQAKASLATRRQEVRAACKAAREFVILTKEILKPRLGNQYSEAWDVTGLVGSLKVPTSPDDLDPLMQAMNGFFTVNPTLEVGQLNLTGLQAGKLRTDIVTARVAVNVQQAEVERVIGVRDEKADKVRRQLRSLVDELEILIPPLDSRWLAFGFAMPGALETPDVPENLRVTLIGNTAAALKWDAAPRAEYYRVWKKVLGVDEEFVPVGSPADVDFTVEELPSNAEIEIAVSAVNNGGESAVGEPQRVRTK
jgi:hypothetical protein